jgi:hypothetical protein
VKGSRGKGWLSLREQGGVQGLPQGVQERGFGQREDTPKDEIYRTHGLFDAASKNAVWLHSNSIFKITARV